MIFSASNRRTNEWKFLDFGTVQEPGLTASNPYATLPHNMTRSMHQGQHTYATPYAAIEPQFFEHAMHQVEQSHMYPLPVICFIKNLLKTTFDQRDGILACLLASQMLGLMKMCTTYQYIRHLQWL